MKKGCVTSLLLIRCFDISCVLVGWITRLVEGKYVYSSTLLSAIVWFLKFHNILNLSDEGMEVLLLIQNDIVRDSTLSSCATLINQVPIEQSTYTRSLYSVTVFHLNCEFYQIVL